MADDVIAVDLAVRYPNRVRAVVFLAAMSPDPTAGIGLEDVARAGDFATYRHRDAARVSMVLSAWAAGLLYQHWALRLGELCPSHRPPGALWAGEVTIEERPLVDLAVVDAPIGAPAAGGHRFGGDWAVGLHPMAVHNATERTVGGRTYDVEQRYESWVQLRSRPLRLRRDLARCRPPAGRRARHATWTATPVLADVRRAGAPAAQWRG